MGLSVNKINNTNSSANNQSNGQAVSRYAVSMRGEDDSFVKKDKANNNKFDFSEALKNFGEGLVSPVTSMFSSPKAFLAGAGMVAGSIALVVATGGAAAPILVAAGVVMGVVQVAEATAKIVRAENGDDVEKAFFDVGGATSTIGLSAWGAKGSLKQANVCVEGMGSIKATQKSFASLPEMVMESFEVFKSGYYKTNITNAIKTIKQPSSLKQYSRELAKEGELGFEYSFNKLKEALPAKFSKLLKGRSKGELSIYEKMVKEATFKIDENIAAVKKRTDLSSKVKQEDIKALLAERARIKNDSAFAKSKIEDLYGARMTFDDASPAMMEEFVNVLCEAMKKGDIEILEIENYRAFNKKFKGENEFYFTPDQVETMADISGKARFENKPKTAGYTAVNMKIKPKGGKVIELQIRGKEVDAFADIEHIPYDLRQGKDIAKGNNHAGIKLSKIRNAVKKLDDKMFDKYQKYIYDNYIYAQAKELGKSAQKPILPDGIDPILSVENLEILASGTKGFAACSIKNAFDLYSQLAFISGAQGVFNEK